MNNAQFQVGDKVEYHSDDCHVYTGRILEVDSDSANIAFEDGQEGWEKFDRLVLVEKMHSVAWSQPDGRGGENGDVIEENLTRDEAIRFANTAFSKWGTAGHPDYKGVKWVVSDDSEVIYSTAACK
jgi:hypothetical protein